MIVTFLFGAKKLLYYGEYRKYGVGKRHPLARLIDAAEEDGFTTLS
jgi:hypothetical protein